MTPPAIIFTTPRHKGANVAQSCKLFAKKRPFPKNLHARYTGVRMAGRPAIQTLLPAKREKRSKMADDGPGRRADANFSRKVGASRSSRQVVRHIELQPDNDGSTLHGTDDFNRE